METIEDVINTIQKNDFMASVDLKDAFFSIPIFQNHQKYLKFSFENNFYKFLCMPNGYGPAMRIFTKTLKVPFAHLRKLGHVSVVYVDDNLLFGRSVSECNNNIHNTIYILRHLGFTIHVEKSILTPTQKIIFLGFVINSIDMTMELTEEKKLKILDLCKSVTTGKAISIRKLASIIGNLVSSFPAVPYGKLFYRNLELDKINALKFHRGNFDSCCVISSKSMDEIRWWINNVESSIRYIETPTIDMTIFTDASSEGWGISHNKVKNGGRWDAFESTLHINCLELLAIYFGIKTFCKNKNNIHVRIMSDNTTAIAYVNNMGGIKSHMCNEITKRIWMWCIQNNIWVSAAHIPGIDNIDADTASREFNDAIEWMLNPIHFRHITNVFGMPNVDLFASRVNKQINKYVSWKPEPEAFAVDAFTINWNNCYPYIFPPFRILGKVIAKIMEESVHAIVIVPDWPTQSWYPLVKRIAKDVIAIPMQCNTLQLMHKQTEVHPLYPKLKLLAIQT